MSPGGEQVAARFEPVPGWESEATDRLGAVPSSPRPVIRLVATDLDGTLLDPSGQITERTAQAVMAARASGIHVVPVTGRPPQATWDLAATAGLGPLGVCANGAVIVDLERAEVLEVRQIAGAVATGLVDLLRRAVPGILLASDDLECFAYERGFFELPVDWQERLEEVDDIRPLVATGCVKLIARTAETTARQLIDLLEHQVGGVGQVTTSGLDWVDIGAPQVSKAYALERVCDRLGIGIDEVVAVGDNHNDLSVLAWASSAMAPANAIPDVLAMVERVLPPNSHDGVAQLLEELAAVTPREL
jgi:Cof subfamily protein (haloacid dehalogenase superfamily)